MSEMVLAAQAVVAGVTVGMTETVQRVARDAWGRVAPVPRRQRDVPDGGEQSAGEPGEPGEVDEPLSGTDGVGRFGPCTVTIHEARGTAIGDHIRQENHFH
ncbi:hypothetical protein OG875_18755 [Streptomyces sp. NBC_01498]|uniref:hypothetical protein n=1 Tax=Streptomyces sp. NBC_01498 TaxID=2975870 RepID=UPI002E7BE9F5|nr:hypothetical protein [Streptomyces sp. NBC_01498]WTL26446.1 hypothetical protein OG875_18755 [Streptomyces sp. NBC_01498]